MNYKQYYENQAGSGAYPVFTGYANQRGHGLGGIFKSFYRFILPIFKTHALPLLKKGGETLGTEAIKAASNIATDALKGKNVETSASENIQEAIKNLSEKVSQRGDGKYKRKRIKKINQTKVRRLKDIFDKS